MKYSRFEDLPVWRAAVELAVGVDQLAHDRPLRAKGDLVNQLERAALSVSNNIAEGFERGTTTELIYYLYVARGSAGEVRSALHVAGRLAPHLSEPIASLITQCESISRQLRGWADSLQNSEIKGQRHLNEASRTEWDQHRRREAFVAKLAGMTRRNNPADSDGQDAGEKDGG
jgi:four helix bundle protein